MTVPSIPILRRSTRTLLALVAALGACKNEPAAPVANTGCPAASGEWGLVGCGRLEGTVVDGLGRPIPGAAVSAVPVDSANHWRNAAQADSPGARFVVAYDLMIGPISDSMPVMVTAMAIGPYLRPTPSTFYVSDTVRTTLYFAPVGVRPKREELKLTIRCGATGGC